MRGKWKEEKESAMTLIFVFWFNSNSLRPEKGANIPKVKKKREKELRKQSKTLNASDLIFTRLEMANEVLNVYVVSGLRSFAFQHPRSLT